MHTKNENGENSVALNGKNIMQSGRAIEILL